jgi:nitrate reductase NapD
MVRDAVNVSSIVVRVDPGAVDEGVRLLGELPGVEVRFTDRERGRIVVTQETDTTDEQDAGLRRLQALPGLLSAELVCHYFEETGTDTEER